MPRTSAFQSFDAVLQQALAPVVARATQAIARSIADQVAARLESEIKKSDTGKRATKPTRQRRRVPAAELTQWVADNRARRVPLFVIGQTGLKTKRAIVAKLGADAAFEKGKPLPEAKVAAAPEKATAPRQGHRSVKAKPPVVRKAAAVGK
jgi:hypothetical protein